MALEKVHNILRMAEQANTAVISFMCADFNMAYAVVRTAEKTNTPALVMLLPEYLETQTFRTANLGGYAQMVRELAADVKVPVGLHLDHSYDYASIMTAIRRGFGSVMIDGSALPLEGNIALTRKVAETAHLFGADVEAEIGHVGLASEKAEEDTDLYTKPDAAGKFCAETGIDALAIAIGNAHGDYHETPHLDIPRLEAINAATDTPLVLHGGSGIPDQQLEVAFRKGVNKFNLGTEFLNTYYAAVESFVRENAGDPRSLKALDLPAYTQDRMEGYLAGRMALCHF